MKRLGIASALCFLIVAFWHSPASAISEFCPATLNIRAVGVGASSESTPAQVYGFDLGAVAPRALTATLAFDTSGGWYTLAVPQTELTEKDRHYTSPSATFIRRDYVSPIMYVRFPANVVIQRSWVYGAQAFDDGWAAKGRVTCDPPGSAKPLANPRNDTVLDPKDRDRLDAPPAAGDLVLAAQHTSPLESTACAQPFEPAQAVKAVTPDFPNELRGMWGIAESTIEVALGGDGSVLDAWVWGPSGSQAADQAALHAAEDSKYQGARAYCRPVSGLYLYKVTFKPNRY